MTKLIIRSGAIFQEVLRSFIDGEKIDVIGNNEIKEFQLKPGNHKLVLKVD